MEFMGDGRVSQSRWKEAESVFETALTDVALNEMLLSHTIAYSRENRCEIDTLPVDAQHTEQDQSSDPSSSSDSVGAILEIRDPLVLLAPGQFVINPPRRLILSAQIRLIRTTDDTVLEDRIVTEEFGTTRSLAEWTADDAKVFREDVRLGAHRLAVTISEQAFILQRFPERRFSMNMFYNGYFTGLAPVNPPMVASRISIKSMLDSMVMSLNLRCMGGSFGGSCHVRSHDMARRGTQPRQAGL